MDSTVRGNQPAGPNRWKRAAQWAAENPHTSQAKKYLARVEAARLVAAQKPVGAWEHYSVNWHGDESYRGQTCSTEHAMLQLQVNASIAGIEELYEYLTDDDRRRFTAVKPATGKRKGKCLVCKGDVV